MLMQPSTTGCRFDLQSVDENFHLIDMLQGCSLHAQF